jgi:hypothetical protein
MNSEFTTATLTGNGKLGTSEVSEHLLSEGN